MAKKKVSKRAPTLRQIRAFDEMVEGGRNKYQALKAAGYSEAVATQPQKVTESSGWQQLMEEYLPDELLVTVHKEGLTLPDSYDTKHKYLQTAYKIRGKEIDRTAVAIQGDINISWT